MTYIAPIVEGHGEREAVPALLHRLVEFLGGTLPPQVNAPIRVRASKMLTDDEYHRRYVELAARKASEHRGLVLILLDCEDDCVAELGPRVLERATAVRSDVPILVTLACREYETWFLSAARSLRGLRGLPDDLEPPVEPERIRDAKGWLSSRMNVPYAPVSHQLEFTRRFDLEQARQNRSFARLLRKLGALLPALRASGSRRGR